MAEQAQTPQYEAGRQAGRWARENIPTELALRDGQPATYDILRQDPDWAAGYVEGAADPFAVTVYGMDRAAWDRYGEQGDECPERCFHGTDTRCSEERQAIHRMEASAEGAWLRVAEAGYPGYDFDPNDAYATERWS